MTMVVALLTLLCCSFLLVQPTTSEGTGVAFVQQDTDVVRCYTCRRASDNEACNEEITKCAKGQFCRTDVSYKNTVMKINKRCRRTCKITNQTFCDKAGTKCGYCCDTDLCNKGLNYNEDKENITIKDDRCPARRGRPGEPGLDGRPGVSGIPGMDGLPGLMGYNGDNGAPGRKGEVGDRGLAGSRGAMGPTGMPGLNGLDGFPGRDSARGPKGGPGLPGTDGRPGGDGPRGYTGGKGDRGDNGLTGDCACPDPLPEVPTPEVVVFYGRVSGVSQVNTNHVTLMMETSVNLGHAYNTTTSVFTAPYRAAYLFSVHVICDGNKAVPLQLFKNEESVASSGRREDDQMGTGAFYPVGIIQVILTLEVGDEVTLRITPRGEGFWDRFKSFMASHSDVTYSGHMLGFA